MSHHSADAALGWVPPSHRAYERNGHRAFSDGERGGGFRHLSLMSE